MVGLRPRERRGLRSEGRPAERIKIGSGQRPGHSRSTRCFGWCRGGHRSMGGNRWRSAPAQSPTTGADAPHRLRLRQDVQYREVGRGCQRHLLNTADGWEDRDWVSRWNMVPRGRPFRRLGALPQSDENPRNGHNPDHSGARQQPVGVRRNLSWALHEYHADRPDLRGLRP